jgi:hypothetical protein
MDSSGFGQRLVEPLENTMNLQVGYKEGEFV